jgi:uncharacterized membrane protein YeaQ/YmgE (transglycosylase-associated protein family)
VKSPRTAAVLAILLAVVFAGFVADAWTGTRYQRGWFSVVITALLGWLVAEPTADKVLRTRGPGELAWPLLAVSIAHLALPLVSGLVQIPFAGLYFTVTALENTLFVLRTEWPAIALTGAACAAFVRIIRGRT